MPVQLPGLPRFTPPFPLAASVAQAFESKLSGALGNAAIGGCWVVLNSCRSADLATDRVHHQGDVAIDRPYRDRGCSESGRYARVASSDAVCGTYGLRNAALGSPIR